MRYVGVMLCFTNFFLKGGVVKVLRKVAVVLVLVLFFGAAAWGAGIEEAVDASRNEQIEITREFVMIESYNQIEPTYSGPYPAEGVVDSLRFILDKAMEMGFKTVLHEDWEDHPRARGPLYGYVEFGPEDAPEMIMSLSHLDTVPPGDLADWTLAGPYEGKIVTVEGKEYIIGRGMFDNKGASMAGLYALKAIKEAGVPLDRRIRLFFGTTEDYGGWLCTAEYARKARNGEEEWPVLGFSPDTGDFNPILIEKTSVNVTGYYGVDQAAVKNVKLAYLYGGSATNSVSDTCSARLEGSNADLVKVRDELKSVIDGKPEWNVGAYPINIELSGGVLSVDVKGRIAHSGLAWTGIGANNRMVYLLSKVPFDEDWVNAAKKITVLLPPDENADNMGVALGIDEGSAENADNVSVCMGRLAYPPTLATSNPANPNAIYMHVNIRYSDTGADDIFPGVKHQSGQEIRQKVEDKFADAGLNAAPNSTTVGGGGKPYTVSVNEPIIQKLLKAYKDATGESAQPCIIYGGTYASAWRNNLINNHTEETFGNRMVAWGIDGGEKDFGYFHEANESMEVEALIRSTKILASAMASLAGPEVDDELVEDMVGAPTTDKSVSGGSVVSFKVYVDLSTYPEGRPVEVYPQSLGWIASKVKAVNNAGIRASSAATGYFDVMGFAPKALSKSETYEYFFTIRDNDGTLQTSDTYSFKVKSSSSSSDDDSSGCNSGLAGLAAFAIAFLLFLRKKD